jgi:hypothetical protein
MRANLTQLAQKSVAMARDTHVAELIRECSAGDMTKSQPQIARVNALYNHD